MKKIVRNENGDMVVTKIPSTCKVQKQFRDMTDINAIMAKYQRGEAITHLNKRRGVYGDFSQVSDYRSSLDIVINAQKAFMGLPSRVRKRFQNDPQGVIDFVSDPKNYNEAVELGLIDKKIGDDKTNVTTDDAKVNVESPKK